MASTSSAPNIEDHLISDFCKITGANEEIAKSMLEACKNNLEMAINMHMDSSPIGYSKGPPNDDVRAPIPPTRGILVKDDIYAGIQVPRRSTRSVFDGLRDFQAESRIQKEDIKNFHSKNFKKRKTLEDLFRPPLDLMHRESFESAREQGRKDNKWLMVNVQDVQEFSCQVLNRDVWSNATVISFIEENFIFWQVYCDSQEGKRYGHFYKVTQFPYIAILDPRTGENLMVWHRVDSITLCDLISEFISKHPSPDGSMTPPKRKKHKPEGIVDETGKTQLLAAIEVSLKENGSKSEDSSDDSDIEIQEAYPPSTPVKKELHVPNDIISNGESSKTNGTLSSSVDKLEDWKAFLGDESDPNSEIMLRYPNGEREKISFPSSSKLKALLLYCTSRGYPLTDFDLVTNFPKRYISSLDSNSTLKELGIFPMESIFIQQQFR